MNPGNLLILAFYGLSLFGFGPQNKESDSNAAQAAAAAPGPAANTTTDSSYVIGASDILIITVWKEPTLSGTILVRPDGKISLALLLGDVQAAGMTPPQLSDQISTKLKKYIQDPNVSVVISQIHSKVVYLLGEVVKRGPVEMTPGMTLLEAIASAGGLTDFANAKKMYIFAGPKAARNYDCQCITKKRSKATVRSTYLSNPAIRL